MSRKHAPLVRPMIAAAVAPSIRAALVIATGPAAFANDPAYGSIA